MLSRLATAFSRAAVRQEPRVTSTKMASYRSQRASDWDADACCEADDDDIDAVTHVGAAPTIVCRHISRYTDEEAAKVLIHEALHHAGLTEAPQDPEAMTGRVINQLVKKKCEL